jgi:hypothetical protein
MRSLISGIRRASGGHELLCALLAKKHAFTWVEVQQTLRKNSGKNRGWFIQRGFRERRCLLMFRWSFRQITTRR